MQPRGNSARTAEHRDGMCSSNERLLLAQDAELVSLGVGENGPRLRAALPDVDQTCPERENPLDLDLGVAAVRARGEVRSDRIFQFSTSAQNRA